MDLLEYIKRNYETPNPYIIKDLGGSEELIEYLRNTPWNTNLNMLGSLGSDGGGDTGEVWLVGNEYEDVEGERIFTLQNVGETDHMTELLANGENYKVFLNKVELSYFIGATTESAAWADSDNELSMTKVLEIYVNNSGLAGTVLYMDTTTAPTSVEVSVKAK